MNDFQTIKQAVTTRQAAEQYGIPVSETGMARCLFHHDRNPSMKLDERYYCFGCGATGDVIDFTAQLFGLTPKAAAEKLARDFDLPGVQARPPNQEPERKARPNKRQEWISTLSQYQGLLKDWRVQYKPRTLDEPWHPLFEESLTNLSRVTDLLVSLLFDSGRERKDIFRKCEKEVAAYARRIEEWDEGG